MRINQKRSDFWAPCCKFEDYGVTATDHYREISVNSENNRYGILDYLKSISVIRLYRENPHGSTISVRAGYSLRSMAVLVAK